MVVVIIITLMMMVVMTTTTTTTTTIIAALKGIIHCTANCVQHVSFSDPGAIISDQAQRVVFHMVRQDSLAVKFHRTRIYFRFISLTEPFTDEGGEETEVPGENP